MRNKKFLKILFLWCLGMFFSGFFLQAAEPQILWEHTYGGTGWDRAYSLHLTDDGSLIVGGSTRSGSAKRTDGWVFKLNMQGKQVWEKHWGTHAIDEVYSIIPTTDGGSIFTGLTEFRGSDAWILKLGATGEWEGERPLGGTDRDEAYAIIQAQDGGYLLAGASEARGADEGTDAWVVKLDPGGNIEWQRFFGEVESVSEAHAMLQLKDGGYLVAGITDAKGEGSRDGWILRLNAQGDLLWDRTFGSSDSDRVYAMLSVKNGFLFVGETTQNDILQTEGWMLWLSAEGEVYQEIKFGGPGRHGLRAVVAVSNDHYLLAGYSEADSNQARDGWIVKISKDGQVVWESTWGGTGWDEAQALIRLIDGSYVMAGYTNSQGAGEYDAWVVRFQD